MYVPVWDIMLFYLYISLENTEDKILDFQFEPVPAKPTCPSCSDGSN